MKILTSIFLLIGFAFIGFTQNKPESVIWGEKLKKTNNLSDFIYKNESLYTINEQLKSIQKFSPDKLNLINTLSLDGVMGELEGLTFDLYSSMQKLIEYKDGFGLIISQLSKDKKKKYFGFFEIDGDLSKIQTKGKLLFEIDLGKKEDYQVSEVVIANENYQGIYSRKGFVSDKEEVLFAQLDIVMANDKVLTEEFVYYQDELSHKYFALSDDVVLIQDWKENSSDVRLYDGKNGNLIKEFSLFDILDEEYDARILSVKKNSKGEYIMAGFYGDISKDDVEMTGLFKFTLNAQGKSDRNSLITYVLTEINRTVENVNLYKVQITDKGDIFFVMTSQMGQIRGNTLTTSTQFEQLMVVGLHGDEIWAKSIPFRQAYGMTAWPDHMGLNITELNGHLTLCYNDNHKNGKKFDYNNFVYNTKSRPDKYICSSPDAIAIIDIDTKGYVKPYFIDVYDLFININDAILLADGVLFISGNGATVAGGGKSRFAKVILE